MSRPELESESSTACIRVRVAYGPYPTPTRLMRQGVEDRVDAEGVTARTDSDEVFGAVAFALPGIAEVGVVRHQHDQAAVLVVDAARLRHRAVRAALRRAAAGSQIEPDVRDLRDRRDLELRMEQRVIAWKIEDRKLVRRQRLAKLTDPVIPCVASPT